MFPIMPFVLAVGGGISLRGLAHNAQRCSEAIKFPKCGSSSRSPLLKSRCRVWLEQMLLEWNLRNLDCITLNAISLL